MMLPRYDMASGIAGLAQVVLDLNPALDVLPVPLNILPSLDRAAAWPNVTI
jgi:hypothetical protein